MITWSEDLLLVDRKSFSRHSLAISTMSYLNVHQYNRFSPLAIYEMKRTKYFSTMACIDSNRACGSHFIYTSCVFESVWLCYAALFLCADDFFYCIRECAKSIIRGRRGIRRHFRIGKCQLWTNKWDCKLRHILQTKYVTKHTHTFTLSVSNRCGCDDMRKVIYHQLCWAMRWSCTTPNNRFRRVYGQPKWWMKVKIVIWKNRAAISARSLRKLHIYYMESTWTLKNNLIYMCHSQAEDYATFGLGLLFLLVVVVVVIVFRFGRIVPVASSIGKGRLGKIFPFNKGSVNKCDTGSSIKCIQIVWYDQFEVTLVRFCFDDYPPWQ